MSTKNKHSAPGQALGYFFQIERSLSWLAKAPAGSIVGMETEDDIVVSLLNGGMIYEQDKSSISATYPFDPNRIDFWKTLSIWLDGLKEKKISQTNSIFYLITSKPTINSLAEKIGKSNSNEELTECITLLKKAGQNPNATIKTYVDRVLSFNDKQLAWLFKLIKYEDGSKTYGKGLRDILISDLQITDSDKADSIIDQLAGWVLNQIIESWRQGLPGLINRDDFIALKNQIYLELISDNFDERILEMSTIPKSKKQKELVNTYVEQLKIINYSKDEIYKAIEDYLKSVEVKTKMAKRGLLTSAMLDQLDKDLVERWNTIFEKQKILNTYQNYSSEDSGRLVLLNTLDYKAKIGNFPTHNYFITKGSYHSLADKLKVGWHPEYKELLRKEKKTNE